MARTFVAESRTDTVKLVKLAAALRRELTTNPKKAAVLALLLAAAGWFWGPIVWRWMGGKTSPAQKQAQVVAQAADRPGAVQATAASTDPGNWRDLVEARRIDPLAQPAKFDPAWPQPFKVQVLETAVTGDGEPIHATLTPAQAGLVLQSIIYGESKRAAMINGDIYREGSEVAVAAPGVDVTFQIARIERTSVSLVRFGRSYRLEFPRPRLLSQSHGPMSHQPLAPANDQP